MRSGGGGLRGLTTRGGEAGAPTRPQVVGGQCPRVGDVEEEEVESRSCRRRSTDRRMEEEEAETPARKKTSRKKRL
jgi:hypothetical protein